MEGPYNSYSPKAVLPERADLPTLDGEIRLPRQGKVAVNTSNIPGYVIRLDLAGVSIQLTADQAQIIKSDLATVL